MKKQFQVISPGASARAGDVEVGIGGRYKIYYAVKDKVLVFGRERFYERKSAVGYEIFLPRKWNWEPPYADEEVPEAERAQIFSDLRSAFEALGEKVILPGETR
jgi:hypothetical protein